VTDSYSFLDLRGSLVAFVFFALFALAPGYVCSWALDALAFRRRTALARLALSVPLSIGISPALSYLLWRFTSIAGVWVVFGSMGLLFAALAIREFRFPEARRTPRATLAGAIAIACGVFAITVLSLIDIEIRGRLYFSIVSYDYSLRTAMVSSIARTGVPPANPYFYPGHTVPLRYHYFWLIPCALVKLMGRAWVTARQAIIGGTLWTALGVVAVVPAFLRFVHPAGAKDIHRRSWMGIALLAVTGLDIIPNLIFDTLFKFPLPEPEWWNNQVSAWATSVLWVPHHTCAFIAGLAAVLLIWNLNQAAGGLRRAGWMAAAGLCLASCVGCSIYVGFVFAAALCVWACIAWGRGWRDQAIGVVVAGLVAVLAAAPHLLDLRSSAQGAGVGSVFAFRVRDSILTRFLTGASELRLNLFNLFVLPLNYFMELGAFLIGGVWILRRWFAQGEKFDRYQTATTALAAASVAICTFLRSDVIIANDLGMRGFLLAQFVLLLWMVDVLEPSFKAPKLRMLRILLAVGVASSMYEVATLRLYPLVYDVLNTPRIGWLAPDHNLGKRTYALRRAYEEVNRRLPPNAIVQHNPDVEPGDLPYGLYADRQAVAETPECGVVFGGEAKDCRAIASLLAPVFNGTLGDRRIDRTCDALSISALLIKDIDPPWSQRGSWVWSRQPVVSGDFVRVLPCGSRHGGL